MKPSPDDCRYKPMSRRPNGALLEKTERNFKRPLGAPLIMEQPRRHGRSARYIRDAMTQGYRSGGLVGHEARYQGNRLGAQNRSSLFLIIIFGRTVITLQRPPVTHDPRASSVQVDCPIAACAFA